MRILHTADIHLAPRLDYIADPARRAERREDVARQVDRLPVLVQEHGVDAVLLAGDVFDRDLRAQPEVHRLANALEAARVPVLIAPGTHDPWRQGGIWDRAWPANIHVFSEGEWRSRVVGEVAFYGLAATGRPRAGPLFQGVPVVEARFQIGVAHASLVWEDISQKVDRKKYPFQERELEAAPFHYLALGDYHETRILRRGLVTAAYPGSPEGISLDRAETGPRHMLLVELNDTGQPPVVTRVATNSKEVLVDEIELDELQHEHPEDALEELRRTLVAKEGTKRLARFDLKGVLHHPLAVDEDRLVEECGLGYFLLVVRDRTRLLPDAPAEANTIRAAFERRLAERRAAVTDERELEILKRAERLAIQALEGLP